MRVKASMVLSAIALVAVIFAMPAIGDDTKALETQARSLRPWLTGILLPAGLKAKCSIQEVKIFADQPFALAG